jgi:thymidylate synthase (FAD)
MGPDSKSPWGKNSVAGHDAERLYANYMSMLNEEEQGDARKPSKKGLARELARINLSLNYYTQ